MSHPDFLYGTAWKEERTKELTALALKAGFVGIDTANQRKHYYEAAVGEAVQAAIKSGEVKREQLFIQTKYTFERGQDHRLPYEPSASYTDQVAQSLASSLEHLHTSYLDSYVLHGPMLRVGLTDADHEAWRAIENAHNKGLVRAVGVSNVTVDQLQELFAFASVKPKFVQNRCYASTKWDDDVRQFCLEHGLIYQGFSLLTANVREIHSVRMQDLARKYQRGLTAMVFRFAQQVGMLPLTGTSNPEHMRLDLACREFEISKDDLNAIENIAT